MEIRADTVHHGLNSAIENFHYHHQQHGADQQNAGNRINIKETGDNHRDDSGDALWRNAASLTHAARKPFHE